MDGPLSARGFTNGSASGSGAVMYPAFVCGHRPLALREYVDRVPIIAARSRRDDDEECPDLGARPFCRHVVVPLPTVGARGGPPPELRGRRRGGAEKVTPRGDA